MYQFILILLGSLCVAQDPISLSFTNVASGSVDISYTSDVEIGGFQFDVSGVDVTDAGGGDAAAAGFILSLIHI